MFFKTEIKKFMGRKNKVLFVYSGKAFTFSVVLLIKSQTYGNMNI